MVGCCPGTSWTDILEETTSVQVSTWECMTGDGAGDLDPPFLSMRHIGCCCAGKCVVSLPFILRMGMREMWVLLHGE